MRPLQRHCLQWLLLIVAVVGQARLAEATCGDYLQKHGDQGDGHSRRLSQVDSRPANGEPANYPVCLGPNCRRHQPIPAQPINKIAPATMMEAILAPVLPIIPLQLSNCDRAIELAAISGPTDRIFRPPRLD